MLITLSDVSFFLTTKQPSFYLLFEETACTLRTFLDLGDHNHDHQVAVSQQLPTIKLWENGTYSIKIHSVYVPDTRFVSKQMITINRFITAASQFLINVTTIW